MAFSVAYYFLLPIGAAYFPALFNVKVWGPINIGLLFGIVFLALFFRAERRATAPLLDLHLLGKGSFLLGNASNFLSYATLFGVFFLIPFVLVRIYHDTALAAGLRLSILPVMLGLLAPVGGALFDRFGARAPTCCGMLICIAALALFYFFLDGTADNLPLVTLALAIFGVGQGLFISPNTSSIMAAAPPEPAGARGGLAAQSAGQLELAVEKYRAALMRDPRSADACHLLGQIRQCRAQQPGNARVAAQIDRVDDVVGVQPGTESGLCRHPHVVRTPGLVAHGAGECVQRLAHQRLHIASTPGGFKRVQPRMTVLVDEP